MNTLLLRSVEVMLMYLLTCYTVIMSLQCKIYAILFAITMHKSQYNLICDNEYVKFTI